MRIAHFIQRYPPALGGSEAYFARLSQFLAQSGDEVTVFTSTGLDLDAFWSRRARCLEPGTNLEAGVTIRRYSLWHFPARRYFLKACSLVPNRLWQCLTQPCNPICPAMWHDAGLGEIRCDAVHASAFPYAWPIACAWRLAKKFGVPFVLTPFLHLGDPTDMSDRTRQGYTAPHLRWLLGQADAVFVQTPTEHAAALELGILPDRLHLQGLGVDPLECTQGDRGKARAAWQVEPGEIVIGHLANQSREKGTIDLLLALEPLWREGLRVKLILAGPEMPNFRAFWESSLLPRDRVQRLGVLSESEKHDFYAGLDLFALPSRSDSFGLVLLEAWANGIPNIAYRAGGIADVIRHDIDGLLIPCGDLSSLSAGLRALIVDAGLRERLGQAGKARLPHDFAWPAKLNLVREVIHDLCKKKSDRPGFKDAACLESTESVRVHNGSMP